MGAWYLLISGATQRSRLSDWSHVVTNQSAGICRAPETGNTDPAPTEPDGGARSGSAVPVQSKKRPAAPHPGSQTDKTMEKNKKPWF